ncbi:MAG: hypothetical protein ACKOWW_00785 [Flavobacteriales bacterium]
MLQRLHLLLYLAIPFIFCAQKPFVGSLEYNITTIDFMTKDTVDGKLFIYARDTLVRINYLLSNGKKQETIHHLSKHKLLSLIEIDGQFFAIQIKDTVPEITNYIYHKNKARKTIAGLKCREANVEFPEGNTLIFYANEVDAQYFVGLNDAPGLPVKGQFPTENGWMAFELQQIDRRTPPQNLFIPDKKYKILSLDAFLQWSNKQ